MAHVSAEDKRLAKEFITRVAKQPDTWSHWVRLADNTVIVNIASPYPQDNPPVKDGKNTFVVANANHVSAGFIEAFDRLIHQYRRLYKDGFEKPRNTVSTTDGVYFDISVMMQEGLQRELAQQILARDARRR